MKEFDRAARVEALNLTDQQRRFCESFVMHFNKARAARESGSKSKNPSRTAQDFMAVPKVLEYIEILKEDAAGRVDLRLDRVLKEQMRIGFSRLDRFIEVKKGKVSLKDFSKLSEDDLAAVQEVIVTETRNGSQKTKLKLHPKQPALDVLLKYVDDHDGDKKKGEKTPGPTKIVNNTLMVGTAIADPKTRKSLEHLSNVMFKELGRDGVPVMSPKMQDRIAALTGQKLVEYMPPPKADLDAAPVDPEEGGDDDQA